MEVHAVSPLTSSPSTSSPFPLSFTTCLNITPHARAYDSSLLTQRNHPRWVCKCERMHSRACRCSGRGRAVECKGCQMCSGVWLFCLVNEKLTCENTLCLLCATHPNNWSVVCCIYYLCSKIRYKKMLPVILVLSHVI